MEQQPATEQTEDGYEVTEGRYPPGEDLRPWFIALKELSSPLAWTTFFGNPNPVEIDVGSGRGLFVFNSSVSTPHRNYLGIEIDFKEGRRAAKRLMKRQLPNARIIGGDVKLAFTDYVPTKSIDAVHLYFPDPWWKKKHHKRRVFTEEFVDLTWKVLKPEGELHVWTDVVDYWTMVGELMKPRTDFAEREAPKERDPEHDLDYQTSFERKKRKDGWPIFRGLWKKVS